MNEPIITTKEQVGEYDAIETAKPGEPLFPLQGGDPFGPPSVLHWVELCRAAAREEENPEKRRKLLDKATSAEMVAWAMQAYQRGESEIGEEGARARYNDAPLVFDGDGDDQRKARVGLIKAAQVLNNAVAECSAIAEQLGAVQLHPEAEVLLREIVEAMKCAAEAVEPRRGNERS